MLSSKWLTIIGLIAIVITTTIIVISDHNKDRYLTVTNDGAEVTDNLSLPLPT